jgi:pimeloyl-ACP methyl ester carboxylesterase
MNKNYDRAPMRAPTSKAGQLLLLTLLAMLLVACGSSDQSFTLTPPAAQFEETACVAPLPAGQTEDRVRCGVVAVPEDRNQPGARVIRLPVIVLMATGAKPSEDPVVFLQGGPGGPMGPVLRTFTASFAAPIQEKRDMVFFDQRGAGQSEPSLDCPEWRTAFTDGLDESLTAEQDAAAYLAAHESCHQRLLDEGADPGAYTSAASAADLRDLMTALGYRRWNIYGVSYGTRLGLTALRDTPDEIRSVVLDSTVPVQVDTTAQFSASFQRSLDTLFAGCAADPDCASAYPDLEQTLFALIDQLNAEPLRLETTDPLTGKPVTFVATGDRFLYGIQQTLYQASLIPTLPLVIQRTADGDDAILRASAGQFVVPSSIARGMFYSIKCNEDFPFTSDEAIAQATQAVHRDVARVGLAYWTLLERDTCAFWSASKPPPRENEAVSSDIPALVLAGEYDPITPPAFGALAASTLSRSTFLEFRGFGHGVLRAQATAAGPPACAMRLVAAFLDDPGVPLDTRCVDDLPPPVFAGT